MGCLSSKSRRFEDALPPSRPVVQDLGSWLVDVEHSPPEHPMAYHLRQVRPESGGRQWVRKNQWVVPANPIESFSYPHDPEMAAVNEKFWEVGFFDGIRRVDKTSQSCRF